MNDNNKDYINIDLNSLETQEVKRIRCIYFLYQDDKLVYIGRSIDFNKRLIQHYSDFNKEFNKYKLLLISENEDINNIETKFIDKYKPLYNIKKTRFHPSVSSKYKNNKVEFLKILA